MAPSSNKRPSDPGMPPQEGEEGPTGKYKPAPGAPSAPVRRPIGSPREAVTMPIPPDGPPRLANDGSPRVSTRGGVVPSSSDQDESGERSTNPPEQSRSSSPKWQELLDRIVLEDDGPDLELGDDESNVNEDDSVERPAASAITPAISGAPRHVSTDRTAVPGRRVSADKQVMAVTPARIDGIAPPPPRMPRLGPEPEFSFGLEDPPMPAAKPKLSPRGPTEDLSFTPEGTADRPAPFRRQPAGVPSSIPLALEPPGAEVQALVERASGFPPGFASPDPQREMLERHALGDFTGALTIAEALLESDPNDAEAKSVAQECRGRLRQMYVSRLGGLGLVPAMAVPRAELKWLSLDHRAGFLLSQLDGSLTIEEILDLAGMPELEVLRTLWELLNQRVIELKNPRGR